MCACVCARARIYNISKHAFVIYDTTIPAGVVALAAGDFHTCALLTGGGVDCWGLNGNGELGTGDTNNRLTPTGVTGLGAGVRGGAVVLL